MHITHANNNIYFGNIIVGMGYMHDGLYYLDNNDKYKTTTSNQNEFNAIMKTNSSPKHLWHLRLGNIVEDRIAKLEKMRILSSLGSEPNLTCESYL